MAGIGRILSTALGAVLLAAGIPSGWATPLQLVLQDSPDIYAGFLTVHHDSSAQVLAASGWAMTLDDDGVGPALNISLPLSRNFNLTANVDNAGSLYSSGGSFGTLDIGGTVADLGFSSGTLLTGDITAFGFPTGGGHTLEFLFTVTGGDANLLFGGIGNEAGIILGASYDPITAPNFNAGFFNTGAGSADAGLRQVPDISSTRLLLGISLAGMALLYRARFWRPKLVPFRR